MLPLFAALVLLAPQQPSTWESAAARLRGVAETYEKWGITFEVGTKTEFISSDGPVPGRLEISSTMEAPDTLKLKVATTVGEKHAMAIDLGGTFKIDPDGNATEGNGAVYIEGTGLAGKFRYDRHQGLSLEAGLERTFYTLGIKLGNSSEGPIAMGLKLGPVTVNIDPSKWARRCREMTPAMLEKTEQAIGGVSLRFDADAMARAIREDDAPPERFLADRLVIALRSLTADVADLGQLNHLDGFLVDDTNQELLLVGCHDEALPPLACDVVAAVARAVFEQNLHPYISLDPEGGDLTRPHRARIGGVPDDLRDSQLIASMLGADYAMKQLQMGHHEIDGIPQLMDLVEADANTEPGDAFRFWINGRPLAYGDVCLSQGSDARYYSIRTTPVISCESLRPHVTLPASSPLTDSRSSELWQAEIATMARALTSKYRDVELDWPDSEFGGARQALELSAIFTLLRQVDGAPWLAAKVHALASRDIAKVEVPREFPGLQARTATFGSLTVGVRGGMTTDIEVPIPMPGSEPLALVDIRWSGNTGTLPPRAPVAEEPTPMDADESASRAGDEALSALRAMDFETARDMARSALRLRPQWVAAQVTLLTAMSCLGDEAFPDALDTAMADHPDAWQICYLYGLYYEDRLKSAAGEFILVRDSLLGTAEVAARRTVELEPTFADGYALQARLQHAGDHSEAALESWNKAIELVPDSAEFRQGRAAVAIKLEQNEAALADLGAALRQAPMSALVHVVRGELLATMDRLPEAISDLETATRLDPTDWLLFDILGRLRHEAGDDVAAIAAFDRALALLPKDAMQRLIEQTQPDYTPARYRIPILPIDNFVKRFGEAPRNMTDSPLIDPELHRQRGSAHFRLEHWQAAQTDLERYARLLPSMAPTVQELIDTCKTRLDGRD